MMVYDGYILVGGVEHVFYDVPIIFGNGIFIPTYDSSYISEGLKLNHQPGTTGFFFVETHLGSGTIQYKIIVVLVKDPGGPHKTSQWHVTSTRFTMIYHLFEDQ
jgi:hypothetical protein